MAERNGTNEGPNERTIEAEKNTGDHVTELEEENYFGKRREEEKR